MTLIADIEAAEFSKNAIGLFQGLNQFSVSDEMGQAVLCAAASILAAEAIAEGRDIFDLIDEFGDLAETFEFSLRAKLAAFVQPPEPHAPEAR